MDKKALMTVPVLSGELLPEAVGFDGDTDWLSRSSDFVGNADGKTLTFSCWVYPTYPLSNEIYLLDIGEDEIKESRTSVWLEDDGELYLRSYSDGGVSQVTWESNVLLPEHTWTHILISIDMTSTSNRYVYINDELVAGTWVTYTVDAIIPFTNTLKLIHLSQSYAEVSSSCRMAHLFMDYTYRDLSIEANRRLFITEDLKPAEDLADLSPILYLPMRDKETAHINEGTGGNFVQNGVLGTASRGPNQDNCVASQFSTGSRYMTRATSGGDQKVFTASAFLKRTIDGDWLDAFYMRLGTSGDYAGNIRMSTVGSLSINLFSSGNTAVMSVTYDPITNGNPIKTFHHVAISVDLTDSGKRHLIVDGKDVTLDATWSSYSDTAYRSFTNFFVNSYSGTALSGQCIIGELYMNQAYMDLATDNPFWDLELNKPVPVRQVKINTAVTPMVALPLSADNPGINLGWSGDFTVNDGPFEGARGGSEFWAKSAEQLAESIVPINYLVNTASIIPDSIGAFSLVISITNLGDSSRRSNETMFTLGDSSADRLWMYTNTSEDLKVYLYTDTSLELVTVNTDFFLTTGTSIVFLCWDGTSGSFEVRSQGAVEFEYTGPVILGSIDTTTDKTLALFNDVDTYDDFSGNLGIAYGTDQYIDFSDENNRSLFVDQLGYPLDLQKQIEAELIPEPLIYMPFDESDNLGKNNGTGGDLTVVGAVTQGRDIDPNA